MNTELPVSKQSPESKNSALKEISARYRLVMNLSGDGIIIAQDGVIRECNRAMAQLCCCQPDYMLNKSLTDFIPPENYTELKKMLDHPENESVTPQVIGATLTCKNGQRLKVEFTTAGCTLQQQPALMLVIRNISERQTNRESLEEAGKLDAISALSGGIAHDYNNLLTAIIGNITLAQTHLNPRTKPFRLLGHALVASKTAKNLTQKLITFSKGGSPVKEIARVDRLVRSATDFTLSGSSIKCHYHFPSDLRFLDVDQSQIGQAIHNVVMNAREAMQAGGTIDVSAANADLIDEVPTLVEGSYVKITIADQGSGIPETEFDRIFEPYYSTKAMGNKRGTGLGLSICRSIIRKHGGDVTVESRMGVGTTMHLYLPAADPRALKETAGEKPQERSRIFGEGKILVMDDEEMIRELAGEILWHLGYEVEFASNGDEALVRYKESMNSAKPFDAVILDLTVRGGMGGNETIQQLIKIDPEVKGIVSSGYSDDPGMTDYKKYGFAGVVAKPYTLAELGEKLKRVLKS